MYVIFTFLCRNKPECNEIHPYISFIPVILKLTQNKLNFFIPFIPKINYFPINLHKRNSSVKIELNLN